jgi:hypothetical protein
MNASQSQPVSVAPHAGRLLKRMGVTHKLTSEQTGGACYLCEAVFAPESGSPFHIHHHEHEVITCLKVRSTFDSIMKSCMLLWAG